MSASPTSPRSCVAGCGSDVPSGRRYYCSDRCSDAERKRRWRSRSGARTTDGGDRTFAITAAVTLAAAHRKRAAIAARSDREATAAVEVAAQLRAQLVAVHADLTATRADARALALIVRRVFQLRDWSGYDRSLRAIVDRHLDPAIPTGQEH